MRRLLLTAGLCVSTSCAFASTQERSTAPAQQSTPTTLRDVCADVVAKRNREPDYPLSDLEYGRAGTAILAMSTDACGRVTSVKVQKSSGYKSLDQAAVDAASHWMFDADARAAAVDGIVIKPVEFKVDDSAAPTRQPDWPKTHRHVRWVLNDAPTDYPSAAAAEDAITALPGASSRMVPYRIPGGGFLQVNSDAGTEFWYVIDTLGNDPKSIIAARYQPVYDNGEPIVRLSVFCDVVPSRCVAFQKLFMKGLSYAQPK